LRYDDEYEYSRAAIELDNRVRPAPVPPAAVSRYRIIRHVCVFVLFFALALCWALVMRRPSYPALDVVSAAFGIALGTFLLYFLLLFALRRD
jgi:hypothetical protein